MSKLLEEKEMILLEKKIGGDIASEFRSLSSTDMEYKLLQLAKHKEDIISTKNADVALQSAKDEVKELNAPYKDQLKQNELKARFLALLIKELKGE